MPRFTGAGPWLSLPDLSMTGVQAPGAEAVASRGAWCVLHGNGGGDWRGALLAAGSSDWKGCRVGQRPQRLDAQ